jgi:hypothetical protein
MTNAIQEILNSLGINKATLEKLQLEPERQISISELRGLVLEEMIRKSLGLTHEIYNLLNPSWYETKLKDRQHRGYKGSKVSHRALQI